VKEIIMAIAIEGCSVVGLIERLEQKYPGGWATLRENLPNDTGLNDAKLWRCSFMTSVDAKAFADRLQGAGLDAMPGSPDYVLVSEFHLNQPPNCDWLNVGKIQNGVFAWREGTTPDNVIARGGWSLEMGSGLVFDDGTNKDLEFRRRDGKISVYFDKRQQREVYVARHVADPEETFKVACQTISQNFTNPGQRLAPERAQRVSEAIADLESIASRADGDWRFTFFMGKGHTALGDHERALDLFQQALKLQESNEFILREIAGIFLELGQGEEAVRFSEQAEALRPNNSEALGNLACAYLIAGRLTEAQGAISRALRLVPDDPINKSLQAMIQAVASGRRPQPRSILDLTASASV
jgi:tetratricopeptide (TPR) repeat protein